MQRPIFLNLLQIRFPITAIVSILHRISGVVLFIAMPLLLLWMYCMIGSDHTFAMAQRLATIPWVVGCYYLVVLALSYHAIAGVRHLLHDVIGCHSLVGARRSAWATLVIAVVWAVMLGYRIWCI